MASLIASRFLSAQGTHLNTLHLPRPPDKHTATLPIRFLPKLGGCSGFCRGEGFYGCIGDRRGGSQEFDRHHAIRYTVGRDEGRSPQAESNSALL